MVCNGKPTKMDDLGVPLFSETSTSTRPIGGPKIHCSPPPATSPRVALAEVWEAAHLHPTNVGESLEVPGMEG